MATIVSSAPFFIPVRFENWDHWRRDLRDRDTRPMPVLAVGAEFCATCWGQGRILSPARNGEGLVPVPCTTCGTPGGRGRL